MSLSIFVGNIPYGAMEREIGALFARHGTVEDVHFIIDHRRGRFRGFGFVTMPEEAAHAAIRELDGAPFQDRHLIVREARQRTKADRRSA